MSVHPPGDALTRPPPHWPVQPSRALTLRVVWGRHLDVSLLHIASGRVTCHSRTCTPRMVSSVLLARHKEDSGGCAVSCGGGGGPRGRRGYSGHQKECGVSEDLIKWVSLDAVYTLLINPHFLLSSQEAQTRG